MVDLWDNLRDDDKEVYASLAKAPKKKDEPAVDHKKRGVSDIEKLSILNPELAEELKKQASNQQNTNNVEMYFNFLLFGKFGYIGSKVVSFHL